MDPRGSGDLGGFSDQPHRQLPDDLPKTLNDRKRVQTDFVPETEMYDGWQGSLVDPLSTATWASAGDRC